MRLRFSRPFDIVSDEPVQQNDHVRFWVSARCKLVYDAAKHRRVGVVTAEDHDPEGDTASIEMLDWGFACRHCGRDV